MNRDRLLARNQAHRIPRWMAVRQQPRRLRRAEPADSAWTDVAAIAWCIAALLLIYWLATTLPVRP
jgi:hypothetical protein